MLMGALRHFFRLSDLEPGRLQLPREPRDLKGELLGGLVVQIVVVREFPLLPLVVLHPNGWEDPFRSLGQLVEDSHFERGKFGVHSTLTEGTMD